MSVRSKLDMAMNMMPASGSTVAGYRMVKKAMQTKGFPVLMGGILVGYLARNLIDDARGYIDAYLDRRPQNGEED